MASQEVSKARTLTTVVSEPIIDSTRYSKWIRLVRVTSWVLRFVKLLRIPQEQRCSSSSLTATEIEEAELYWVKWIQQDRYGEVIARLQEKQQVSSRQLKSLDPFLDDSGILRVGGRLQESDLPYAIRHPIILPPRNHITTLIVRRVHADIGKHAKGVNAVLGELRQRFWLVFGREEAKRVDIACVICTKQKKKAVGQIMAPLPSHRVTIPIRAFARSGVDYGGPFTVKITRNTSAKRWLCLFTCTTSRAVHLEIAYSLDTHSFLNAFSRMVARRGKPEIVISDNGTNFHGAERELSELIMNLDHEEIVNDAANKGITWRFDPPWGSHHGGLFEALIKSAKRALRAILWEARVNDEELQTAVTEVEGLLNSRPLTYSSNDPKDETVLTPNNFLIGQSGGQLAPRVLEGLAFNPRHRWRYVQDLVSKVWRRWNKEFLSLLQNRGKWLDEREDLQVDDVVLLADPTNPRGRWPLGKIMETLPCSDGHVRSVKVLSCDKILIRPISKLCKVVVNGSFYHGGEDVGAERVPARAEAID
ncbi:uncharacterized protein LOC135488532 [Lineus longissimus]|uniref:uncharacterized protein LOC135488532 n=1 Tax=Lineus longissimus TaxID=88925 RepID=UPI00315CA956